jgi:Terpene synthase family 2, C-terminal metal binding
MAEAFSCQMTLRKKGSPLDSGRATVQEQTLFCPFPAAINPHADWVQDNTARWAQQHRLILTPQAAQQFRNWQYGMLMARAYPTATRAVLSLIADWNTWLFLLDDQFDEGALGRDPTSVQRYCTQAVAILRGDISTNSIEHPAFGALRDIATRLIALAHPSLIGRLIRNVEASFGAAIWEASNRIRKNTPSEEDYLHYRPLAGAVYCYLTLVELAARIELPEPVRAHPAIQQLTTLANHIICYSNDLISFPKEHANGNAHNLVVVVQHARQMGLDQAIEAVITLHNETVQLFIELCDALPSFGSNDSAVRDYVDGLQWWIRANMDWSSTTTRYQ